MALVWLSLVEGVPFAPRDLLGAMVLVSCSVLLSGMAILMGGKGHP